MDPMTLMALMQMGQGLGGGLAAGNSAGWGSALQGSVLGGYLQGRGAKKAKKKAQKRFGRALNASESIQGRGIQQQEALSRQATAQTLGGYDAAKREASRLGRGAKQDALDRGTQLEARAAQGLTNRGLGSTTVGANLSRGIQSDVSRERGRVDEGLAGLYGDLALGRAGAEAAGTAGLASIAGQQTDLMDRLQQMRQLGGATLGSTGTFDPNSFQAAFTPSPMFNNESMGALMGGGGMGGGAGGMNPQLMQMIQQLFSQGQMG